MSSQAPDIFSNPLPPDETERILIEVEKWRPQMEAELGGTFTTEVLPTGRVLIKPVNEIVHVAYMSDETPDARLIFEDYVPEIGDPTLDPNRPSDDQ